MYSPGAATRLIPCDHVDSAAVAIFVFTSWVRTFQTCNTPGRPASRVASFIRNVTNIFVFYFTQNLRPATQGASYNLTESQTAKTLTMYTGDLVPRPRTALRSVACTKWVKTWKRGWRFQSDGICPIDGTRCQRNNCESSYKGEITTEETQQINGIPIASPWLSAGSSRLWRSVMQIHLISQEPARLHMRKAPFHGTVFPLKVQSTWICDPHLFIFDYDKSSGKEFVPGRTHQV